VIVADGLSSTSGSERASFLAVTATRRELSRTGRPGRTPAEAIDAAYRAAADALTAAHGAANRNPYADSNPSATTLLIAIVSPDGTLTVGWVGDSRAYWLDATSPRDSRLLTVDHTTAGIMIRWLAPDHHPGLTVTSAKAIGPGLLVATTDGLHGLYPTPADLASLLGGHPGARLSPTMTTPLLAAGPRRVGGTDDTTAAAVLFNPTGPRTTGSGSETAPHQLYLTRVCCPQVPPTSNSIT
jgi:hypothetical protein